MKINIFIFVLFTTVITACSTSSKDSSSNLGGTHFYSLSALSPSSTAHNTQLRIGVGPIEIPRLLNRPQIISRKNNTEILMAEKHQWGGSYKEELIQTIADNLSHLLNTENIEQYPWKFSFKPKYHVRINIERFDGELGKNITLKARWRLYKNNQEILVKRSIINSPISGGDYNSYVKAQSRALEVLSQKIAAHIK